mmetsp:Transcript_5078/g.16939  ORF Transcript_5078/g.16939 Transcript_5078/m.16939 type:complete len:344 (+) Transcript_5078:497-1528(+)
MIRASRHRNDALPCESGNLLGLHLVRVVTVPEGKARPVAPAPSRAVGGGGEAVQSSASDGTNSSGGERLDLLGRVDVDEVAVTQAASVRQAPGEEAAAGGDGVAVPAARGDGAHSLPREPLDPLWTKLPQLVAVAQSAIAPVAPAPHLVVAVYREAVVVAGGNLAHAPAGEARDRLWPILVRLVAVAKLAAGAVAPAPDRPVGGDGGAVPAACGHSRDGKEGGREESERGEHDHAGSMAQEAGVGLAALVRLSAIRLALLWLVLHPLRPTGKEPTSPTDEEAVPRAGDDHRWRTGLAHHLLEAELPRPRLTLRQRRRQRNPSVHGAAPESLLNDGRRRLPARG